ncbi:24745_t:CDS:2, partial [Gigaspora rosea]
TETQLENDTEEIAFINLIEYVSNKFSNLDESSGISFNLCIELDNNTLTNAHNDTKLLVKLIVDKIEEGDRYNWTFTTGPTNSVRHSGVSKFYLVCTQSCELEREYKESNRRRIDRFDCHGKLVIGIDIATKKVKVKHNHDIQHKKPIDVTTPEKIKCEIMHNLHMDPVQLRTQIYQKFDALQVTPKQINYWWSTFNQQFFKLDEDPFTSICQFLDNPKNNGKFCYEWNDELVMAIGFITPLLIKLLPIS